MPKIAFIGAGSVVFTRALLGDILVFPELRDVTIALHDIDPQRLETATTIARQTAAAIEVEPTIEAHLERRRALDGADYVINSIQVGMHEATVTDFDIPSRYGLHQTIGDTLGVGGIFRALRTIPVMLGIAHDMGEVCGDAWLLNYTNPMAMLCQAVFSGSPVSKVVGLCHSIQHTTRQLAGLVGVPFEQITFLGAGINHQSFILRFERGGESLYPRLDESIERDPELGRRVRVEIYRRFGYFPTESSEHFAEYVPWFMHHESEVKRLRIPVGEYVRRSAASLTAYAETRRQAEAGASFEITRSHEYGSLIIHSIETGQPRVVYGNVRNQALITNLPDDICVELPCLVDATGVSPTVVGELPPQLAALNRTFANVCDLTVRAAVEGKREHVYHAALLDPNASATLTVDQICALVDEMVDAHAGALPEGVR